MTRFEKFKKDLTIEDNILLFKGKNGKFWVEISKSANELMRLEFEEYVEPQIPLDTPMDAPVLVSDNGDVWARRHFKCIDEHGRIITWRDGRTSFSTSNKDDYSIWKYVKLPESEE